MRILTARSFTPANDSACETDAALTPTAHVARLATTSVSLAAHVVSVTEASVSLTEPSVSLTVPSAWLTEPSVSLTEPSVSLAVLAVSVTERPVSVAATSVSLTEGPVSLTRPSVSLTDPSASYGRSVATHNLPPKSTARSPTAPSRHLQELKALEEHDAPRSGRPSGARAIPAVLTLKGAFLMSRTIVSRITLLQLLIAGIGKHLAGVTSITLAGVPYPPPALAKLFQELVDAINAATAARTAAHDALVAERAKSKAVDPVLAALKSYLLSVYSDAATLADFGLTPRKPRRARTQAEGAATAAKRRATRVARHTLGKRQKAAIHGAAASPTGGDGGAPTAAAPAAGTGGSATKL